MRCCSCNQNSNREILLVEGHERLATLRIIALYFGSSERKRAHINGRSLCLAENKDYVIDISITMNRESQIHIKVMDLD